MEEIEIIQKLSGLSYGGIFFVALTANIIIPVPEEITLLASGFLVAKGIFNFAPTAFLFITGMLISDTFLYHMAKSGTKYISKFKKKIAKNRYLKDSGFVKKHIIKIIVISRFVIYLRWIGPVLSGTTRTPFKKFIFWDFVALIVYVPFMLFLGDYFQNNIGRILSGEANPLNYLLVIVGVVALIIFFKKVNKDLLRNVTSQVVEQTRTWIPGVKKKNTHYKEDLEKARKAEESWWTKYD
jgi:membrane protein DedA with SNARE-associated domain